MLCNICEQPELTRKPDGSVSDSVRSNANPKLTAKNLLCSKCTQLLLRCRAKVDWSMDLEGLKAALNKVKGVKEVNEKQAIPLMRRTK